MVDQLAERNAKVDFDGSAHGWSPEFAAWYSNAESSIAKKLEISSVRKPPMTKSTTKFRANWSAGMTDITKLAHLKPGKYAILYRDNWDGEENEYHMMAVLTEDGDWYDNEFNAELLKYQGDEILKVWPLDDSSNVVALEKAQQRIAELESAPSPWIVATYLQMQDL
jgi:hypothetical protein